MQILAAILWMCMTVQDKPVSPAPAQLPAPTAEQLKQAPGQKPEQKQPAPVVLPEPKSVRVIVSTDPQSPVFAVQPDGERKVLSDDEVRQLAEAGKLQTAPFATEVVVKDGKVYLNLGGMLVPMSGSGASGCFGVSPERNEQIQKEVRLQLEKEKADAEKKK